MVCECRKSACRDTCQCQNLGLECADLCKCSGNSSDETEVNDIEAEQMMKEITIANRVKHHMQIQTKKIDRTQILLPRPFFLSEFLILKKKNGAGYKDELKMNQRDIQTAISDKGNNFRIFLLKFQNKHIKIFTNFLVTSGNEFCQRFKLIG